MGIEEKILDVFKFAQVVNVDSLEKKVGEPVQEMIENLVDRGIVKECENGYTLTTKGLRLVTTMQDETLSRVSQPLMAVFPIVRREDEILLHKRTKQPFFGYIGFPGGKLEFGETIGERAIIELEEETGLIGKNPKLIAMVSTRSRDETSELIGHNVMFFFEVTDFSGKLIDAVDEGKNFWAKIDEVKTMSPIYPDLIPVLFALKKERPVFIEMNRVKGTDSTTSEILGDYFQWRD